LNDRAFSHFAGGYAGLGTLDGTVSRRGSRPFYL